MSIDATMWAWKQQLSPTQKLILLSMADRAGEDFTCWPSNTRLCIDTGLNRKTVYACIAQLIDMGLIVRSKTDGVANIYQLVGVSGREMPRPKTGAIQSTRPEKGTGAESGTSPENGQQPVPKTDFNQSQKRDIESLRESLKEPPKEESACTRHTPAPLCATSAPSVLSHGTAQAQRQRSRAPDKPPKNPYGEFGNVLLTVQEYSRLEAEYGPARTLEAIHFLDLHLGARKGADPYKSHYLAMRKWVFDAVAEKREKQSRHQPQPARTGKSFDQMCAEADVSSVSPPRGSYEKTAV